MKNLTCRFVLICAVFLSGSAMRADLELSRQDYIDRVEAIWTGQIISVLATIEFEHRTASVLPLKSAPLKWKGKVISEAPVDDDWYYEMAAVRAFEKYGIDLTVAQLGEQWLEDQCGSWGSSEQARLNLQKGIKPPATGHPRYNKFWFTLGPQFSSDVYGALAPGLPNVAGRIARDLGHINGYAEGTDGAVFTAAMISLGFTTTNPQVVVREAVRILHPSSPYRQCIEQVIGLADAGKSFPEIIRAVEDRWHHEYPATNNAVANGGIVAAGLWFGRGDFWVTTDLIARAADFTDTDCNAANAASVIGAMHGMKSLPREWVAQLNDRIVGDSMGSMKFNPPVNESISGLAQRVAVIGEKILRAESATVDGDQLLIPTETIVEQAAERFTPDDIVEYWNSEWTLERAGVGGVGGGAVGVGLRNMTYLEDDILSTYPRDEVRGCVLRRTVTLGAAARLTFEAGAEPGRAWELVVYADNTPLFKDVIGSTSLVREWRTIDLDLTAFAGQEVVLRLYQRVYVLNRVSGNALWRNLQLH